MTRETQGVMNIVSKCQVPSSNGLGVKVFENTQGLNYKGVCRAALVTPGLLIMSQNGRSGGIPIAH